MRLALLGAMPRHSRFADADAARRAIALARPMIEAALADPAISGMGVLHLVVLDPAQAPADAAAGTTRFEDALLHEELIGDPARCDVDYGMYARAKARLSWRHGQDGRRLQWLQPHRLSGDDPLLWGSVCLDGIVVAASGAMPAWDEAFALCVAAHLRAIALVRAEQARAAG